MARLFEEFSPGVFAQRGERRTVDGVEWTFDGKEWRAHGNALKARTPELGLRKTDGREWHPTGTEFGSFARR